MGDAPVGPLPADLTRYLATARLGRRVYFYPAIESTNDAALALARAGEPEGTLVMADHQRRGRGRREHTWTSAPGRDVLCSLILRPPAEPRAVLPVTLAVATAISVALSKLMDADVYVKWPNDIVTANGKLGGILAESATTAGGMDYVVVGIGLNVNSTPEDLPAGVRELAVSCRTLTGSEWDRAFVLADVLGTVEAYYDRFRRDGFGPLVSAYEARLWQRGREVAFERDGVRASGTVLGVAGDGALRVRLAGGAHEVELYHEVVEVTG
ncbi:MAG TPA: biotin--[acetyl-CoA-carboxylase] ligase [Candidatus Krumholzibacteria bacterium]|nr:biotin--[acetyl-CoA-carboxylase] ligase [Candidatus Krumholzibacteria bacterium]